MIIDCISDLHGYYPKLKGGDLLIVAGDLTAKDTPEEWAHYFLWQREQDYKKIVFIAGNHDNRLQKIDMAFYSPEHKVDYLCDSGTEFSYHIDGFPEEDEGFLPSGKRTLKIWGTPWTKTFEGMNSHCKAFTVEKEEELADKFEKIPHDTDILITHSPPLGILDKTSDGKHVGSRFLYGWFKYVERPKLHVFGHIHEAYGQAEVFNGYNDIMVKSVNASHVNERYKPVNKPIRVIL